MKFEEWYKKLLYTNGGGWAECRDVFKSCWNTAQEEALLKLRNKN